MNGCEQIQRTTGLWYSAEYSTFSISDEVGKYRLTVDGYSGDAGNALMIAAFQYWESNGMMFSTPDSDNDGKPNGSCAAKQGHGWWFRNCSASRITRQPNGIWSTSSAAKDVEASRMLVKLN